MQINSTLPTTTQLAAPATTNSTAAASDPAAQTSTSGTPSQDDAVNISTDGAALAAQATQSAQPSQTGNATQDATTGDTSGDGDTDSGSDVSPVKSFAYGSLGLERPDQPQSDGNSFYTAGRWLAAGITIGGLVSLLI
ncbi:hypothetical protein ABH945_007258 [Paraburkholderia sp. GAS333]|uniref:hypothetical protein n=1 Tax=Paraburkholderia sp. GAS333 TaxID=3156279 RepID=UPI003D2187E6